MKLPNYQNAVIPESKITGYLLSSSHREGRGKARFFSRFGFSTDNWQVLSEMLTLHAAEHEIAKTQGSPFGTRYVVEGKLNIPSGKKPLIRSIWFLESGENIPRFVTAYPLRRRKK